MRDFLRDFNKRVAEINKYFELVDKIEQLGAFSTNTITFPSWEYTVDSDLQKILKSHCYLLLYNLIESSMRNGITSIHDAILTDQLTYNELSPKIRKLWLQNDQSKSFRDSYITKKTVADNLEKLIKSVSDNDIVSLVTSNIPISGNLDAETIQQLIDMYGFFGNLGVPQQEIGNILNSVVSIRCDLAHGNTSFVDATNQKSWTQLVDEKDKLINYLTCMLQNIDNYIDQKKYKV